MPDSQAKPFAPTDHAAVLEANRRFYDQIATVYDQVDSRRQDSVNHAWLDRLLDREFKRVQTTTRRPTEELVFLDAGAGSGFLSLRARNYFKNIILADVSQAMLDRIPIPKARKILCDCAKMPLPDGSVDFVGAFATLHHLHEPALFFKEAHRVLRRGGLLYCDHDIERQFVRHFGPLLKLYRAFFDHGHEYLRHCPQATPEDYHLSEFHGDKGLDGLKLAEKLRNTGFEVLELRFHWEGMGAPSSLLKATRLLNFMSKRGLAPIIRIVAKKL